MRHQWIWNDQTKYCLNACDLNGKLTWRYSSARELESILYALASCLCHLHETFISVQCRGTNLSSLFLSDRIHLNAFTPLHSHQELKEFRRWNQLSLCVSVNFFFNLSYYLSRYRPCDKWKSMQAMLSKLLFYCLQMHKDRVLSFVDFWFHHMVLTFLLWFQDEVFPIIKMIKEKVW